MATGKIDLVGIEEPELVSEATGEDALKSPRGSAGGTTTLGGTDKGTNGG